MTPELVRAGLYLGLEIGCLIAILILVRVR